MEDNDHSTWLNQPCGLVRIARSELDAWVSDPKRSIHVTVFDGSDGVRGRFSAGRFGPKVTKSIDGKIWFSPLDGVSVIDPRHLPFNKLPPPVYVEQITADDKKYDASPGLRLPPHVRDLTIDYTALSLVAPEKVHFRFKLEGQDQDWREVVNRTPGGVLESTAAPLPVSRNGVEQQWRVERGRGVAGLLDCARLLPDELVPRSVCSRAFWRRSGPSISFASAL